MDPQLLAGQPGGTQTVRSSLYPTHFRVFLYFPPIQTNPLKMSTYQLFMTFSRLNMRPKAPIVCHSSAGHTPPLLIRHVAVSVPSYTVGQLSAQGDPHGLSYLQAY